MGDRGTRAEHFDELLSTLAHELGTPIAVVRGYLELLRTEGDDPGLRHEAVAAIERNLDLVDRLVLHLRDLRELENGGLDLDLRDIDLGRLTREIVDDLRDSVLRGTPTSVTTEDGDLTVRGDPSRIRQVLFNLLSNAVEYSPSGAEIALTVGGHDGSVAVIVRNHGSGVAPEDRERIFEKFARATDRGAGTGLGLYISRRVARAHGGDLTAEPAEEEGSRFVLRLPTS